MTPAGAADGRRRAVIENISPCVDHGRFAAKRCAGDLVTVEADIFADGHDRLRALLLARKRGTGKWSEFDMVALVNDRWPGSTTSRHGVTISPAGSHRRTSSSHCRRAPR